MLLTLKKGSKGVETTEIKRNKKKYINKKH